MNEESMTLDFAIQNALDASERQDLCEECRKEHKQLADWLSELRDIRSNEGKLPVVCHSMTNKEAILILECMAIDMLGRLADLSKKSPMADVLRQKLDAIDVAQAALRAKDISKGSNRKIE